MVLDNPVKYEHITLSEYIDKYGTQEIEDFDCCKSALNSFIKTEAIDLEREGSLITTVFCMKGQKEIIGFYAIRMGTLRVDMVVPPAELIKFHKYSQTNSAKPADNELSFPMLEVVELAVNKEYQNQGFGTTMLGHLFEKAQKIQTEYKIGFYGIYLNALLDASEWYENLFFNFLKETDKDRPPVNPEEDICVMYITMNNITQIINS